MYYYYFHIMNFPFLRVLAYFYNMKSRAGSCMARLLSAFILIEVDEQHVDVGGAYAAYARGLADAYGADFV